MVDKPTKQDIGKKRAKPAAKGLKKPKQALSDKDLGGVTGGRGTTFVQIKGPSWSKTMAYRKAEWVAEPAQKRSVVDLHKKLAAESDGGE
jgi:hypothetical protein